MPNKVLSTYVKNFQFFPKSAIYDDDARYRISEFNRQVATLYFIVRTRKARFIPSSFKVNLDYSFSGLIEVGDKQLPITFNCPEMHYQVPELKTAFPNWIELAEYAMKRSHDPSRPHRSGNQKYAESATVDVERSTESRLVVDCPVKSNITREHIGEMILSPYQLFNLAGLAFPAQLEIIYIGKSNDDTWNRIYNHNKWGLIEEHRDETQELLVYFLEIDKSSISDDAIGGLRIIVRDESELSVEDATIATEAAFINHFIREKRFNRQHVGSDITKSDAIVDRVKARGYTDLVVELEIEGPFGTLGTSATGFKGRHKIEYKL